MKISLISVDGYFSLGIRYLSAKLRSSGFETKMIFFPYIAEYSFPGRSVEEVYELVSDSDAIGVSSMAYSANKAIQIIERLKNLKVPVIFGGVYPTTCPEECIKYADIICRGEGEDAISELAARLNGGTDYLDVENFWIRNGNGLQRNGVRPLKSDLDSLPFPDYDNSEQFVWEHKKGLSRLEYRHIPGVNVPFGGFLIFNIRGCPYSCTYCVNEAVQDLYDRKLTVRRNSIPYIMRQLEYIFRLFPQIERIRIDDDTFFVRPLSEIREFSAAYKSKYKVPFECNADPKTISEEKIDILFDAGLRHIGMGIQSASKYINSEIFKRPFDEELFMNAARLTNRYAPDLAVSYDFIVLNPDERKQDIMDNLRLVKKLPKPFRLHMNSMVYFPGTAAFDAAIAKGINVKDQRFTYYGLWTRFGELRRIKCGTKNKYLNTIILLIHGQVNRQRYGNIPTKVFNAMTDNRAIALFNDKLDKLMILFIAFSRIMIHIAAKYTSSRQRQLIKNAIRRLAGISL